MSEWPSVALEEIAAPDKNAIAIGPFGSRMKKDLYVEAGVPVIRGTNITGSREFQGDFVYVSESTADELGRANVFGGDLVFPHRGAIGEVGIVPSRNQRYMLSTSLMKFSCDREQADPLFLYYFFRSAEGRYELLKNASQVGTPGIARPLESLRSVRLKLPPLSAQQSIAHILGTLDDKIELNRRMNRTMEALARAIFKSWFIDFGPVHAKAEGREPVGLDPETAALFPDSFQDSPLGKIPKGWEVSTVGEEFQLTMGQSPPGSTYNEDGDGLPFFQGRRDFGLRFPTRRVFCAAPKRIAEAGDTLVTVRAPVGDVNMAPERLCVGRGLATVRHRSGSRSYTYYSMISLQNRFREYESEGTVFGAINKSQFSDLKWVAPPNETVAAFENQLFAVDERIGLNEEESFRLAGVRDAVLPELMLGRVP